MQRVAFRQANCATDACRVDHRERPVRAWCGPISDDGGGGPRDWISDIARMFDASSLKASRRYPRFTSFRSGYIWTPRTVRSALGHLKADGGGKVVDVATIVQKTIAAMERAHIIILDLHGEYCWNREDGSRHYAFADTIVRHVDARDLEIPYWLMTYAELCDLLIEHSEREATNQTAFFRDCLLEGRKSENASATPVLGLSRVTVDTPIYFSLTICSWRCATRMSSVSAVGKAQCSAISTDS